VITLLIPVAQPSVRNLRLAYFTAVK
jgi:hypothetical protein